MSIEQFSTTTETHRWNIELDGARLRICRGIHERGAHCRFETWVPSEELDRMKRIKEAYRYFIDAHDNELAEAGITREDALRRARDLDHQLSAASAVTHAP